MISAIIAVAGSMVNISDGSTFLGTTTTDAGRSRNFIGVSLSDRPHSFTAADNDMAGNASAVSRPVGRSTMSFSATPRTSSSIDGTSHENQTAGQRWSLSSPDPHTLRFEIRPDDRAWFDSGSVDRSEVASNQLISNGAPINMAYKFMLQPDAANTASWFVTPEMYTEHTALGPNVHTSPPFAIELAGEHPRVLARYCPARLDPSNGARNLTLLTPWTDPDPIRRGQYYDFIIQANAANTSDGHLDVWANGAEVVNYHGPLGHRTATSWKEALYRLADAFQTVAANFRDLKATTGAPPLGVSP
jgi:hypothetical protein